MNNPNIPRANSDKSSFITVLYRIETSPSTEKGFDRTKSLPKPYTAIYQKRHELLCFMPLDF
ncbi:hypothetical protein HQ36_07760 [Porphyromonas gingivicanis]|uniref:Uncharacterized protein n=1 Tax=Porphyromonas gingivicanis TaxID=266762 RepID=A0A0A2G4F2_9PORP|nr:hypothetical protein HQ36_07760 [Porphyromonas gingivicanis]